MMNRLEIKECRSCSSEKLTPIISLGNQYVVNFIKSKKEQKKVPKVPLELVLCENCKLLQLKHNAPPESMWGDQYWYRSGINKIIRDNLKEIVNEAKNIIELKENDFVVDIGCNDGTLFEFYDRESVEMVGFEPSKNVAREATAKGYHVIKDFFNAESFRERFGDKKAKIITAISMFYDLEDPNKFLKDIVKILDVDGLFVIQQNYLIDMLENNAFDNICHEHREYYSLKSLKYLLDNHGLEIFDVERNEINGGSIRTLIRFKGGKIKSKKTNSEEIIKELENKESGMSLDTLEPYKMFAQRIEDIKQKLLGILRQEKSKGKKICGLGASTRGLVLLQYFGLDAQLIDCIFDKNPDKEGKLTIGSLIPITNPNNIEKYNPDYQLVLIWHLFKGIGEDEKDFVKKGGKFILPLPNLKIKGEGSTL